MDLREQQQHPTEAFAAQWFYVMPSKATRFEVVQKLRHMTLELEQTMLRYIYRGCESRSVLTIDEPLV